MISFNFISIDFYYECFRPYHGDRNYLVRELWYGLKGTISAKTKKFSDEIDYTFLRS